MLSSGEIGLHILLADDDSIDRELFAECINATGIPCTIHEAANGVEVFTYLDSDVPQPNLIILDLNMPIKDGRQTLVDLKQDNRFRKIPVFILSTSNAHFDVEFAYANGANLFLVKPHDFQEYVAMFSSLLQIFRKYMSFSN